MNWHCRSAALFVLASDWSCCVLSVLHCVSFEAMSSNLGSLFPTQCLSYLPSHLRPCCFCGFIVWFTILLFLQRVLVKIGGEPQRFERAVYYLHVIPEWHCVICMTSQSLGGLHLSFIGDEVEPIRFTGVPDWSMHLLLNLFSDGHKWCCCLLGKRQLSLCPKTISLDETI